MTKVSKIEQKRRKLAGQRIIIFVNYVIFLNLFIYAVCQN